MGLCLNKWVAREILRKNGIPVPQGIFIDDLNKIDFKNLCFPLFLKPCSEDGSLGIDESSYVEDEKSLRMAAASKLKQFPKGLVAEEFISGKEYAIGIIGNNPYEILGVGVLDYSLFAENWSYLTYDSKWMANTPEYTKLMPVLDEPIAPEMMEKLIDLAIMTAEAFKCRGYFRMDARERNGELFVIDVNPNPDTSKEGGFMRMSQKKGYTYEGLFKHIIELATKG